MAVASTVRVQHSGKGISQGSTFQAYDGKHYPRFTQKHAACMDTRLRRSSAYQRMDRAAQRKLQALVRATALRSPCTAPVAPQALRTEVALTVVQRAQPVHMTSTARRTTAQEPVVVLEYKHECVLPRAWVPVVSHMLDALTLEDRDTVLTSAIQAGYEALAVQPVHTPSVVPTPTVTPMAWVCSNCRCAAPTTEYGTCVKCQTPPPAPKAKPAPKAVKEPVVSTRSHAVKGRTGQEWAALDYDAMYGADEYVPAPVPMVSYTHNVEQALAILAPVQDMNTPYTPAELQHYGIASGEFVVVQGEAQPMPIPVPANVIDATEPVVNTGHVTGCTCYECLIGEPVVETTALVHVTKPTMPERTVPAPTTYTSVDEAWDMGYTAAWAGKGRTTNPLADDDGQDWHDGWTVGAREYLTWSRVEPVVTRTVGKKGAREWATIDMQNA